MSSQYEHLPAWTDTELDAALDDLLTAGVQSGDRSEAAAPQVDPPMSSPDRRRWSVPLIAAAAVIATIIGAVAVIADRQRTAERRAAAAAVSVNDGVADIGGVRFPIPAGWSVATYPRISVAVSAYVVTQPRIWCGHGKRYNLVPMARNDCFSDYELPYL